MNNYFKSLLLALLLVISVNPQSQHTIMSYNLLNYPGSDTTTRNPHYRTIFESIQPDILIVQEMQSQAGVDGFLSNVLNVSSSGYAAGLFINGPDTDRAIFYKSNYFTFISNTPIQTTLRDINEFKIVHNFTQDTLLIYVVHLKASSGPDNEQRRLEEVTELRNHTDSLPTGTFFIVAGDFNIYRSSEPAFQKLLDQSSSGYFIDPLDLTGSFNQFSFAQYHTQSPRTRSFGGGAVGGMDDRFDMILISQTISDINNITYINGSTLAYGNDGNHYNDSINSPPNTAVGQQIADALHNASDHLPLLAMFQFNSSFVELASFTALIEGLFNGESMIPDTVTVELRNSFEPYALVDEVKILLNQNGNGSGRFYTAVNNIPYYLVLKHRNALETWSSAPLIFTNNQLAYDFTTSQDQAFGNNLKLVGNKWCIYSGDVNQDGMIETDDLSKIFTDNVEGVQGYTATDLNGDNFIEIEDINIVFRNSVSGIEIKRPADY